MCTVSFVPKANGFYLAMNRDESRLRPIALAPEIHRTADGFSIYPTEPGGGTWVGLNNSGLALALINWHRISTRATPRIVSRGIVVRELISARNSSDLPALLGQLPLEFLPPFRLISVNSRESLIKEFRWDQNRVVPIWHRWAAKHWFSSGLDEPLVEKVRSETCREAWNEPDAGGHVWLRRLHRSHHPNRGGLSICMHREDAFTVSYSEIIISGAFATMRYHPGSLCEASDRFVEKSFSFAESLEGGP